MKQFKANVKGGLKYKTKRQVKKLIQYFHLPAKDKGKKIYFTALSQPLKENYVFYEAFAGLGILDNPRAIFQYLLSDPEFSSFVHIWSVDNLELSSENIKDFSSLDNVIIVKKDSDKYYQYLATCKYLISNSTFGYYFEKRSGQVYINTWHGVPTKYMGYEHTVERVENARGPARNFLAADYIVSANEFMTDIMYRRAYKLDGLFNGKVLETGHPRSDAVINSNPQAVYKKLNAQGIKTDKKIILYAPTWKGNLYNQLDYNIAEFKDIVEKFSQGVDTSHYRIYLRVHYFLYKILAKDPELGKILIPFTIDTNELLSVVDILISDYSSIFFDFLITGRPMIFYVPDLENYRNSRGLYVPVSKLPGLVSSDIKEVQNALCNICNNKNDYLQKYEPLLNAMKEWCIYNDDGSSCKRLVNIVFKNREIISENNSLIRIINGFKTKKKRLLICINTRLNDWEFFESFRNTLSEIDYEKTDVTLLVTSFKEDRFKTYFNNLPPQVRVLVWYALPFVAKHNKEFYQREILRTLGNAKFDEVQIAGEITEYWAEFANNIL